jgi:ATP-binding cassette subfamily A (ABC1) protein 3
MAFNFASFRRQTWALCRKNFTIIIVRSWLSTIIRAVVLPILLVTLLAEIPNLTPYGMKVGVGSPAPVQSLAQSMNDGKTLAIVQADGLGPEVPDMLKRLTEPLDASKILYLGSNDSVNEACAVDFHGNSNCHAVITINDSPLSGRVNATWNYTLVADPSRQQVTYNVFDHSLPFEGFWLPLQAAIDNAISNTSVLPDAFSYANGDQAQYNRNQKASFLYLALYILSFVFFASMATMSHHVASMMSSERESGISQLVDAMGGDVVWPRVMSYVITFDILYLPIWIILGCSKSIMLLEFLPCRSC